MEGEKIFMDLADGERDMVTAALASCSEEQEFARRIRQDSLAERQRRAEADRADHERLVRGLLASAGIDIADLERRRERNTAHAAKASLGIRHRPSTPVGDAAR